MDTQERWVTVGEAARLLSKSDRTIRRWVANGKLAADRTESALLVDIAKHVPSGAAAMPSALSGADALLAEIERLRAELSRCQADLDKCQAERAKLFDALEREQVAVQAEQDNARALVDALASGQLLLTEGERRRPWWRFWERAG